MQFRPDASRPLRDRKVENSEADIERAEKRKQDDARIDSGAEKWRYVPPSRTVKNPTWKP
jgi:hypothetical protein